VHLLPHEEHANLALLEMLVVCDTVGVAVCAVVEFVIVVVVMLADVESEALGSADR
jgi:hypothetical protein